MELIRCVRSTMFDNKSLPSGIMRLLPFHIESASNRFCLQLILPYVTRMTISSAHEESDF